MGQDSIINQKIKPLIKKSNAENSYKIQKKLGIDPLSARLFSARGFQPDDNLIAFLHPRLGDLPQPDTMADYHRTIKRIVEAIANKETIAVYGDYDVDGIGSVAIFKLFLDHLNIPNLPLISERSDGYGFDKTKIDHFSEHKVDLIIVCDVGSTEYEAVNYARDKSIDLIIIDHHQIKHPWPQAYSIINPQRYDCKYEFKTMASVGLVFHIVAGVKSKLEVDGYYKSQALPDPKKYLDIVALGTLADVSPLKGINRILVKYGLKLLKNNQRKSIKVLKNISRINQKNPFNERTVIFKLIPRLNAAGRMNQAFLAMELLTSTKTKKSLQVAEELNELNTKRQEEQKTIYKEAVKQAEASLNYRWSIVVSGENWNLGIVGIVAAKLVEKFKRPAVVIGFKGKKGRGSIRTWRNIDIYNPLSRCQDLLITFGGHSGAAGLEIETANIRKFAKKFDQELEQNKPDNVEVLEEAVDAEISLPELTPTFMEELKLFAPFGNHNPEPVFLTRKLEVVSMRYPAQKHISLYLKDRRTRKTIRAIGFNMFSQRNKIKQYVDIIYTPEIDYYRGGDAVQLKLHHIIPA
jgi:single-stranded-DNA-specific exonuclease